MSRSRSRSRSRSIGVGVGVGVRAGPKKRLRLHSKTAAQGGSCNILRFSMESNLFSQHPTHRGGDRTMQDEKELSVYRTWVTIVAVMRRCRTRVDNDIIELM